ncbi:MAG: enoyl-CoA hydratase/isomerase family protein [Gammaproteobacteria bacterium]|nr:enoyl-CoA hydratase/isomerase family protein [Gammaproteobacteria bacterium]
MTDSIIQTNDTRGVTTIKLNRPEVHNAFDEHLIADLTNTLKQINDDDAINIVILASEGKNFSAGADLNWMRRMADYDEEENRQDALRLAELLRTLNELNKPTIARVQGAVFGGGVGLVACCDIAVASNKSTFSLSEVLLGLVPATISPYVISAIGARAARRYFLTGGRFSAQEALRLNLIHELSDPEIIDETIDEIVDALNQGGPHAQATAKQLIASVSGRPIDDDLNQRTASVIAQIRTGDEGREGVAAFLEKRAPHWRNN